MLHRTQTLAIIVDHQIRLEQAVTLSDTSPVEMADGRLNMLHEI